MLNFHNLLINGLLALENRAVSVAAAHDKMMNGDVLAHDIQSVVVAARMEKLEHDIGGYELVLKAAVSGKYARLVIMDAITSYVAFIVIKGEKSADKRRFIMELINDALISD